MKSIEMKIQNKIAVIVSGAGIMVGAASVAGTPKGNRAAAETASVKPINWNEVICRHEPVLGSRTRTTKTCKTRGEWQGRSKDAADALDDFRYDK
jgi:hypothetical protein